MIFFKISKHCSESLPKISAAESFDCNKSLIRKASSNFVIKIHVNVLFCWVNSLCSTSWSQLMLNRLSKLLIHNCWKVLRHNSTNFSCDAPQSSKLSDSGRKTKNAYDWLSFLANKRPSSLSTLRNTGTRMNPFHPFPSHPSNKSGVLSLKFFDTKQVLSCFDYTASD